MSGMVDEKVHLKDASAWYSRGNARSFDSGSGVLTVKGGSNYVSTVQKFSRPLDVSVKMRQSSGSPECGVMAIFPTSSNRHSGYNVGLGWWSNGFGTGSGQNIRRSKYFTHGNNWHTVRIYAEVNGMVSYYLNGQLIHRLSDSTYASGEVRLVSVVIISLFSFSLPLFFSLSLCL